MTPVLFSPFTNRVTINQNDETQHNDDAVDKYHLKDKK